MQDGHSPSHAVPMEIMGLLVIRWSGGMVRKIFVREMSHWGEAAGWAPVWHWAHNDFLYHTDAEPNNKFYHTCKSMKYLDKRILYSETYQKVYWKSQNFVNNLHLVTQSLCICYADFTQPPTQDDTLQGRWMHSLRSYWHGTVSSRVRDAFDVCVKFT